MKKTLLEIYALAACFALMIFLVVSIPMCLFEILRIIAPSATVSAYTQERSASNERFLESWPQGRAVPEPSALPRLRQEAFNLALRSEQHDGVVAFLRSLMYVIVTGSVFALHWQLAQREGVKTAAAA
jgi:hypothetical protein